MLDINIQEKAKKYLTRKAYQKFLGDEYEFEFMGNEHRHYIVEWRNKNYGVFHHQTESMTVEDQDEYMRTYHLLNRADFVMKEKNGEYIGVFTLKHVTQDRFEIGKIIGNDKFMGKGLGRKAGLCLIDFGFNDLNLDKLYALTKDTNVRNIKLNESFGFVIDEHLPGHFVSMLLKKK